MGGNGAYLETGGFSRQDYKAIGNAAGIKVLTKKTGGSSNAPLYSNTPGTMYVSNDRKTGEHKQITVYGPDRRKIKDIDWGHRHENKQNRKAARVFEKGEVHVQEYKNGVRISEGARSPSPKERRLAALVRSGRFEK